jgi:hypothetical protein
LITAKNEISELSKSDQISCLRGFYHKNYEAFRNRNPDRVADTCEWFLDHPEYDKWKTRESSSLLWVSADPGCGKSVLAKFLVDHLRKPKSKEDRPEFVCHFFFKDDSDEQRSGVLALRALLHQIFTDDQALLRHAFDAFEFKGLDMFDEFESLWDILSNITRDPEAINLVIILDGLDECESVSQGKLLENINKLYGHKDLNTKPFLRMILLSRPETIIQNLFCQNAAIVRLRGEDEPENISKDVELVVRSHIKDLVGKGLPLDTLLVLQKALIDRADRTFLWITLIIDLLEDAAREGASQKELEDLLDTRDIDALYAHLLQKFVTMDRSKKLLQMVLAAARPLTLKEVNVALAVSPQQFSFKELKSNLRYPIENHIKTLCGHFIRIIRSKVYLVHQTARDFLLQQKTNKELTTPLGTWQHLTTLEECQVVLLRTCISYLFLTTVAEDKKCDATGEFLDYASEFWPTGFARTNHHILDDISDDISDDIYDDMWDDMSDKIIDKGISSKHLEIGCRDIFDEIVDITLHRSEQSSQGTNQWFSAHELILHLDNWRFVKTRYWLSHTVHQMFDLPIVRLLGDNAVNVNATDTSGSTLLHYACANGSPELVKTLLRKGADVFAVDSSRNTAMHVLVQPLPVQNRRPYIYSVDFDNDNRLILIAEELLANHVDINALTESKETPLHLASERGLSLFANWLVSHGADINAVNENSETILHSAVKSENAATIDAILDCNVDLTQVNGEGKTAFEALTRRPTIDGSVAARVRAYGMPELDSEDIQRLEYQDI